MDDETRRKNLMTANYCFLGNPGTGKTTVARLFAAILCDSGIRKQNVIVETTAQQTKDGGTEEFRASVNKAMDGVLFIDEAYDLDPVGDFKGRPIVNEMLTLCENDRDKISFILAGYEDEFQERFFKCNPGLKSRLREVFFEDFDGTELAKIWTDMRTDKRWDEAEGVCSVVVKRMMKQAGRKGFGNAREVRKRLESSTQAAMARLGKTLCKSNMCLEIQDVIGEDPRLSSSRLLVVISELHEKIGWRRIKEAVQELIELCGANYHRELLGKPPLDVFLNRMFLGNPGTGKTTCAKLYGRLLKELGFLSNGDVVSKAASDFVGSHAGESQAKTNQILESSHGKVLIIDEAYALDDSLYGKQVLDTLVEKVQGSPSDDIAILLLGYEEPMLRMISNQNPGLSRRFPKEKAFYFDDYDETELLQILELNLKQYDVESTLEFSESALGVLLVQKTQSNFGNAGAVEQLVKGAMQKFAKRASTSTTSDKLQASDIEEPGMNRADKSIDPLTKLDKLYRMEKVKAKLAKMKKAWAVAEREGDDSPALGHFVFRGSPGKNPGTSFVLL
jgi:replication-associated recombination protein RarA